MPLAERIKQLRTEARLSQAELAERSASDARQISRYEHGRVTSSLDATIRIAQALNGSIDYLTIDDAPRRPLRVADRDHAERLGQLAELNDEDRETFLNVLDAFLTHKRLHTSQATHAEKTPAGRRI